MPAADVTIRLMRRGWLARAGDDFVLSPASRPSQRLRLTVHELDDRDADRLAGDIADAVEGVRGLSDGVA